MAIMYLPTYEEIAKIMAKELAEKALDEYVYKDKTLREWINIIDNFDFAIDKAAEALLEQTRWIPCSEKLPDRFGKMLVTFIPTLWVLQNRVFGLAMLARTILKISIVRLWRGCRYQSRMKKW